MATAVVKPITVGPNRGTNAHASENLLEGASQTFKKGSPIIFTSGYAVTGGSNPGDIVGFAEEAGENNSTAGAKKVRVLLADGGQVFEGTFANNGDAVALAQTDLGLDYGLTAQAVTGLWYVDKNITAGANARVTIVGFRDAVGTSNARVYFKVQNDQVAHAT